MGRRKRTPRKHTSVPAKAAPATVSSSGSNVLDFQAPSDDAWYGVRVAMDSEDELRVMYVGFSKEYDELYAVDSFKDEQELNEFASRFRRISLQLQDSDCRKVIEGMHVCASLQPSDEELRFHDASVHSIHSYTYPEVDRRATWQNKVDVNVCGIDDIYLKFNFMVEFSEHDFVDGEEICKCTFTILWLHGPMVGERSSTGIESICLHQPLSSQLDPALDHFLHRSKMRFEQQIKQRDQRTDNHLILPEELEIPSLEGSLKDTTGSTLEVMQDQELGGGSSLNNIDQEDRYPIIEIKNLAKNISIQEVANTVHQHTSLSFEIILNPGLHENSAIIYPEDSKNAQTIYEFLQGPGYYIMSSKGRGMLIFPASDVSKET